MRASMADLVEFTRRQIADESIPPHFSDDEIEAALDRHMREVRYEQTRAHETRAPGGALSYLDHAYAGGAAYFETAQLTDQSYNPLATASADLINGRFTLAASCAVVMVVGKSYDPHGAGADLVEEWSAEYKLKSNFMESGLMVQYGQRYQQLVQLAERLRKRARASRRASTGRLVSTDFSNFQ